MAALNDSLYSFTFVIGPPLHKASPLSVLTKLYHESHVHRVLNLLSFTISFSNISLFSTYHMPYHRY